MALAVRPLIAAESGLEPALDTLDLAFDAADPRDQLVLLPRRVTHSSLHMIGPMVLCQGECQPRIACSHQGRRLTSGLVKLLLSTGTTDQNGWRGAADARQDRAGGNDKASASTKASGRRNWCANAVHGCCSCRLIRPFSILSRWPTQSSGAAAKEGRKNLRRHVRGHRRYLRKDIAR